MGIELSDHKFNNKSYGHILEKIKNEPGYAKGFLYSAGITDENGELIEHLRTPDDYYINLNKGKGKVKKLKEEIKVIQDSCVHAPEDVTITYKIRECSYGNNTDDAWFDIETHTYFHCDFCDKKWKERKKISKDDYNKRFFLKYKKNID